MLTPDELAALPIFSTLSPIARTDVARAAGVIRLNAGEYAVYEGEPPALFVVIEGAIEVIKTLDGIERRLGFRLPGTIFGEVPLALGTPFPGGFRAGEPSRVVRVDARRYYDARRRLAGLRRDGGAGARADGRPAGHHRRAAQAPATMIGNRWDGACPELRRFLARNQISFDWLTPDAPQLADTWPGPPPRRAMPVLRLADGTVADQPGTREVARLLGLQTAPRLSRIRHGDHRRRPGRPRGGGVRRVGRAAHDHDRARSAGRPSRHVVADRELPRLPDRRLGRRTREPGAAAGQTVRRRDSRRRARRASIADARSSSSTAATDPAGADDHPRDRRVAGGA